MEECNVYSFEDGLAEAWEIAKHFAPDLPETYQEARIRWEKDRGAGSIVEVVGKTAMILSRSGDKCCVMFSNGETTEIDAESVRFTGRSINLSEIISDYAKRQKAADGLMEDLRQRRGIRDNSSGRKYSSVRDTTTGRTYSSIKDWCKDTGLSSASASRLLSGERETVGGHSLEYSDD